MTKYSMVLICCFVTLLAATIVFAQGLNVQPQAITVSQINTVPNKTYVTLTGNITQAVGREYYTFRDSTGEITIEIERKVWGGITVGPSDHVEITAEVEIKRGGRIEVEAKMVKKI